LRPSEEDINIAKKEIYDENIRKKIKIDNSILNVFNKLKP